MNDELLDALEAKFLLEGWTYRVDGQQVVPSRDDIDRILLMMRGVLSKEPDQGMPQMEIGRMIMKRRDDHYDVFIYLGEYNA